MSAPLPTDLDIANAATLRPIADVAADLGVRDEHLEPYGRGVAKIDLAVLDEPAPTHTAKYVVVTAVTPTPLGEGKTTTSVGLAQALHRLGQRAVVALRQPSMGPTFGIKGGAAGGGYSQVVPMERLNLHLTGDFHAVTSAHNLLAAMIDNHLHHGNELGIDVRNITWRRVLDVNDRALRNVVIGLGARQDGLARETGFDITAASEVMVLLTLAISLPDLRERLGRIVVGYTNEGKSVTAEDLHAAGAMTAILEDALKPTCSRRSKADPPSSTADRSATSPRGRRPSRPTSSPCAAATTPSPGRLRGDMGAERFFDVKCRVSGLKPDVAVIVATVRALKTHSGRYAVKAGKPLPAGLLKESPRTSRPGSPTCASTSRSSGGSACSRRRDQRLPGRPRLGARGHPPLLQQPRRPFGGDPHVAEGGAGALELAQVVVEAAHEPTAFEFLYPLDLPLEQKIEAIATQVYGADGIDVSPSAARALKDYERLGYGGLPVVIAKTHLSISSDPSLRGAPRGWRMPVREVRAAWCAGYVYAICGDMRTMPGLPTSPNAERIDIAADGSVTGLF